MSKLIINNIKLMCKLCLNFAAYIIQESWQQLIHK